jgi:hypothetical protein
MNPNDNKKVKKAVDKFISVDLKRVENLEVLERLSKK